MVNVDVQRCRLVDDVSRANHAVEEGWMDAQSDMDGKAKEQEAWRRHLEGRI